MSLEIKGGTIYREGAFVANEGLVIENGEGVIDVGNSFHLPGRCDVHVHFREPGQEYKETIETGSRAAARGGFTTVCTMPNLNPPPGDLDALRVSLACIERGRASGAAIQIVPYGTITRARDGRGELSDMEALAPYVCGFSDDGTGVQDRANMRAAMELAKSVGRLIVAHCEDDELVRSGRIRESEWRQIERDVKLADETGCGYHVCHISCRESVEVIREAKKSGVDVTCETAPHYLLLDTDTLERDINAAPAFGGRYKMNPPIKDRADRIALIEGALDGTVDMIATDHAPHSDAEKRTGFAKSLNGITGLECAFPALYTWLVQAGAMPLERLVEMMADAPRRRFGFADNGYSVWDFETPYRIDSATFCSKGKWTPFDGWPVYGRNRMTICDGRIVWKG